MRKLFGFLVGFLFVSVSHAGFKTDHLTITTSSITINGTSYRWNAGVGSSGQCLQTDGASPIPTLTWGACSGGTSDQFLLLEDSSYVLLEDGTRVVLE